MMYMVKQGDSATALSENSVLVQNYLDETQEKNGLYSVQLYKAPVGDHALFHRSIIVCRFANENFSYQWEDKALNSHFYIVQNKNNTPMIVVIREHYGTGAGIVTVTPFIITVDGLQVLDMPICSTNDFETRQGFLAEILYHDRSKFEVFIPATNYSSTVNLPFELAPWITDKMIGKRFTNAAEGIYSATVEKVKDITVLRIKQRISSPRGNAEGLADIVSLITWEGTSMKVVSQTVTQE